MAPAFELAWPACTQNVFISEDGSIKLIDNDLAFTTAWGTNSLFIPGTPVRPCACMCHCGQASDAHTQSTQLGCSEQALPVFNIHVHFAQRFF